MCCILPNMTEKVMLSIQASGGMEEWRRLKLKVLRQRVQRLVVLMDLSEPGTVPDPGMLASLVDLVRVHVYHMAFCINSVLGKYQVP